MARALLVVLPAPGLAVAVVGRAPVALAIMAPSLVLTQGPAVAIVPAVSRLVLRLVVVLMVVVVVVLVVVVVVVVVLVRGELLLLG